MILINFIIVRTSKYVYKKNYYMYVFLLFLITVKTTQEKIAT